jgi:D-alanine-D-alanine ligase
MSEKIKLCVLFGGQSPEHDVSILSAESVLDALDNARYSVDTIWISREGGWYKNVRPGLEIAPEGPAIDDITGELRKHDIAFPVLHGKGGEDGAVQGIFEIAGIPYVGADVQGSALCMDKVMSKTVCRANGIEVIDWLELTMGRWMGDHDHLLDEIEEKIGSPSFVKPCSGGSSIGTAKVSGKGPLAQAIEEAFVYDDKVIVEKAVDAREIECALLGNDVPKVSVCGEIIVSSGFYDYDAKYSDNQTELVIPAKIEPQFSDRIREIALDSFKALQCKGMARADFFVENGSGRIYLNELNTIPGFTARSMYPMLWEASGISYSELLDQLIGLGFAAHAGRKGENKPVVSPSS